MTKKNVFVSFMTTLHCRIGKDETAIVDSAAVRGDK